MNKPQAQPLVTVLIISMGMTLAESILECLGQFEAFAVLGSCRNGVTGLKAIASQLPELVFIVAPLPDRMLGHVIKEAKRKHPEMRMILVADWTEFAGFARANQKGADGFISARLLSRELPLVLAQYPLLPLHGVGAFLHGRLAMAWPDGIRPTLETSC